MSAIAMCILAAGVCLTAGLYKLAEAVRHHGNCVRDAQILESRRLTTKES